MSHQVQQQHLVKQVYSGSTQARAVHRLIVRVNWDVLLFVGLITILMRDDAVLTSVRGDGKMSATGIYNHIVLCGA